ncbi:helix-turn-helix domain-containing protein [Filimonas effusa]|uniref:AraC family transcriptional regulator n=1 Tax=Filimonas effusa TaxID=2508721 RepID=A0A4Q1D611_9BACT|nr:response regulator transcription factor [Filimonas effusa]RXK83313.1 AraC family transcriptional regulator [Filimonas effusa]
MQHFAKLENLMHNYGYPPPESPMFSMVRCNGGCGTGVQKFTTDFYIISLKKMKSGSITYGRTNYDSNGGSLYFMKPQQMVELRDVELEEGGFSIYIREDYLFGHPLHDDIKKYHYFDYDINEALHLSPSEEKAIWDLFDKIEAEYHNTQDEYTRQIILTHVDAILKYSQRYYKRQFLNRANLSGVMVTRFNRLLEEYRQSGKMEKDGIPTVKGAAEQLHVSPRYLSDLLKTETGKTAQELIHLFLIAEAKNILIGTDKTIAETAYSLGFENLPYFSRLFKKQVGKTPVAFRNSLN